MILGKSYGTTVNCTWLNLLYMPWSSCEDRVHIYGYVLSRLTPQALYMANTTTLSITLIRNSPHQKGPISQASGCDDFIFFHYWTRDNILMLCLHIISYIRMDRGYKVTYMNIMYYYF